MPEHLRVFITRRCINPLHIYLYLFAAVRWLAGWMSVTFVYCVETAKDTAIVAMECE